MILKVNGTDITSFVRESGMKYRREELGESVTTMDKKEHFVKSRDRVTVAFTFIPLTRDQLHNIISLFKGNSVSVTYYDMYTDGERTMAARSDYREASFYLKVFKGAEYYDGLTITFKEL